MLEFLLLFLRGLFAYSVSARLADCSCDARVWTRNGVLATERYPLYAFLRRQGYDQHDAQDLTQSFFAFVLEREALQTVHSMKGKFRSFLLASLKNFLANEWDKARALKRGGRFRIVSIDDAEGEALFQREPSRDLTPDKAFEQSWAMTLFNIVLARLQEEYLAEGKPALHDALQPYLTDDKAKAPHAETARQLGMSEGAVRMAVLRMRRRFGELLRAEIAHTVATPEEIDEEIRAAAGGSGRMSGGRGIRIPPSVSGDIGSQNLL